jgi:Kdo2-lipid IVA lauroyltransferase/acyltransferase
MAKKGKALIWTEYLIARSVFGFLSILPRRTAVALGIGVGKLGYRLLGGLRRVAMRNLEIAFPEMPDRERAALARGTFENLGRVLGETSQLQKASKADIETIVDFELSEEARGLYQKSKAEGRGVLITTGHLGNWELLVLAFGSLYEPISYLARPIDNPLIEEFTSRIRRQFGNRPINKTGSVMTAIGVLREGGILGILSDVNAHPKEAVFVPFFNVSAATAAGAAMIAIRANALVFPAFCVWDKEIGRFKFVHGAILEPANTGDRKADIAATTAAYTAEIEKIIRRYPDQWMWIHRRWKTRPKGEAEIY